MLLNNPINHVLTQLSDSLTRLTDEEYRLPVTALSNAHIGQHVRHMLELFQCLMEGYETGNVNYETRKRDAQIESERTVALELIHSIYKSLDKPNKTLILETGGYAISGEAVSVQTNYFRELVYNIEHCIHHMALIRIGIQEVSGISLPEDFGVAYSTIKYREQCAL